MGADLSARPSLCGLDLEQLQTLVAELGEPLFRAKQLAHWLYQKRSHNYEELKNLPATFRAALGERFTVRSLSVVRHQGSADTTQKFLLRLADGRLIESVLIPASPALYGERSDRLTLCISTQVGCAYGCKFCASGLKGWTRDLQASEIVEQILLVEEVSQSKVSNLVFMGMGEPLANYENWLHAVKILNASWGLKMGARKMTVSTSGLAPRIKDLADQALPIRLAVSLHGARDHIREKIMPINRRYNLATLLEACVYFRQKTKQRITFEYILIDQVNDDLEDAEALSLVAQQVSALVNLIPYNTVTGLSWKRPSQNRQETFFRVLKKHGVSATLRREKGHDIDAACGQLRLQAEEELNLVS
ncbi:MAG: 23S rRNA (adenine(2503)-C(2))-methyltransferase RlmN [Verrucomicrobiales bacterium]